MHCPRCGAESEVLETRQAPNEIIRRRRICANGHRFITFEVHSTTFTPRNRRIRQVAETIRRRVIQWKRDQQIVDDWGKGWQALADKFGLSRAAVFLAARRGRSERRKIPKQPPGS